MGKLRIVPEGVYTNYNQSMLSGYAAIAFSLDRKSASAIAAENKLSNIISRHIIDMKYETLINEQIRITNYLTNNYFVWNKIKPHSDLIDICINYRQYIKKFLRDTERWLQVKQERKQHTVQQQAVLQ